MRGIKVKSSSIVIPGYLYDITKTIDSPCVVAIAGRADGTFFHFGRKTKTFVY